MNTSSSRTIFALSSGQGRAAVSIIRLSGPSVRFVIETLAGDVPPARKLVRRQLRSEATGEALDDALVVFFPGPASFTGEDCAELHIHGGSAVRAAILRALTDTDRCRPAHPGEFTRRAFMNGKLDLTAVEGLADLIDAETEGQRRQALRQLEGTLGALVTRWAEDLTVAMAHLEALIDFSDEGDVDDAILRDITARLQAVSIELVRELSRAPRGEKIREGFKVAITGPVNAGKSTLLNALARRDVAIVSEIPGTTRDVIEVKIDIAGFSILLVDTAGFRETDDPIEALGIARAKAAADGADLVLHLSQVCDGPSESGDLKIGTKRDLFPSVAAGGFDAVISAETGEGVETLLDLLQAHLIQQVGSEGALITRERHRLALQSVSRSLARCETRLVEETLELAAEDVRLALRSLGEITGQVGVEQILGRIFSSFCIGK